MIQRKLNGPIGVGRGKGRIGRGKCGILGNRLLERLDTSDDPRWKAVAKGEGPGAEVQIVRVDAGFITPTPAAKVQPQLIDDAAGVGVMKPASTRTICTS